MSEERNETAAEQLCQDPQQELDQDRASSSYHQDHQKQPRPACIEALSFDNDENPFSYYHQDNRRSQSQSGQDQNLNHFQAKDKVIEKQQKTEKVYSMETKTLLDNDCLRQIEIGDNLAFGVNLAVQNKTQSQQAQTKDIKQQENHGVSAVQNRAVIIQEDKAAESSAADQTSRLNGRALSVVDVKQGQQIQRQCQKQQNQSEMLRQLKKETICSPKPQVNTIDNPQQITPSKAIHNEKQYNEPKSEPKTASQAQKQYQLTLLKQMDDLKKSVQEKDKKKNRIFGDEKKKEIVKPNLNKTVATFPKKSLYTGDYSEELEAEELKMLVKMAFEKKKENYQMLKEWDRKRAQSLALHGKMVEQLQNEVDKRIKSSMENFEIYLTFFRQKAKQEQKYCTSPVINTRYALQNNSLSKNVYINCSVILNTLSDDSTNRCKNISDFVQLIRSNILRELAENHLNQSQKELLRVREKISTLKGSLKKYNTEAQQKTNELASFFNEHANNITNKTDKDFYRTQLSFLRQAAQQINVQKKLGEYCLEYYHTAIQEQIKRSQVIREAMLTYAKGLKETYDLQLENMQIEQLSKYEQIKLIEEFYSLEEMFDERSLEVFKAKSVMQPSEGLSIQNFTAYINKQMSIYTRFGYEAFDSRIVLLKEFYVKHLTTIKNAKNITEQHCYLVITVDNFLHLFFSKEKSDAYAKPDITIKIAGKSLQVRSVKDEYLDIIKKEQKRNSMMSYFWDNKVQKTFRLKFGKKDSKEQFVDYIKKLMVSS